MRHAIVLLLAGLLFAPHALGQCGITATDECEEDSEWLLELSGTWEQQWTGNLDNGEGQKFEAIVEPRFDLETPAGMNITSIFRLRIDSVGELGPERDRPDNYSVINGPLFNDANVEPTLHELYVDTEWGDSYWRIGKQQVVWGQADGIKVLDVVNPQSFREFVFADFNDSRIPTTMLNAEFPIGDESALQLLWVPDTTYHELAEVGSTYSLTSNKLVPQAPPELETRVAEVDKPDDFWRDSDAGAKLSTFAGGWDLTLNYLYHYQDFPVLYQSLEPALSGFRGVVSPQYERNHMLGGSLSNVLLPDLTLRAELAHNTDTYHLSNDMMQGGVGESSELAAVVGLDWHVSAKFFLSGQFFQSTLLEYRDAIVREKDERYISLVLQQNFLNETLQLNALLLHSLNYEDSWLQVKLKHVLQNNVAWWLGANIMDGDRNGPFGQFADQSHFMVGSEIAF